ncbi:hypothetical protein BZG36_02318 [Bifiguratus adelaidae]|uniref:Nuclear movement protein nudC n=1 Tax=Bifiguratus adelaidae TaxID=1938954 RepID=A0A261Y3M8_9FUNG|nr:hypothetical protein BZG36_02318 [Bifiguratus adelaidae]
MSTVDKIKEIEAEMARTQKNKATSLHLGLLKAKLAKLRRELLTPQGSGGGGSGVGFDVAKTGVARVGFVGFPSVGKSTLMSKLTGTHSEVGAYEFTTLTTVPGVIQYKGAKIQMLDLPGIIEGAKDGKGRGRQVIAVARTCSLIFITLDVLKPLTDKGVIEREMEGFGIRLNKKPPNIIFRKKEKGGINMTNTVPLTHIDQDEVKAVLSEYRIHNADVSFKCDATIDELIDVIEGNRIYIPCIYVLNKIDQISIQELDLVYKIPYACPISAHHEWNFDELLDMMWQRLDLARIYTKPKGQLPDYEQPVVLKRDSATVEDFCNSIHKAILPQFRYALVWGSSVKHNPQKVGKEHVLQDEDVVQIVKNDVEKAEQDKAQREKEAAEQAALPYQWKQTLQDVDVSIPVPKGTRAKDLVVSIKRKALKVGLKAQEPIIDGELCKDVQVDDSTWTLEDQSTVLVHLEKVNQMTWWENVITTAPKIDTSKIQPENSNLSDLDTETRSMVEKMMPKVEAASSLFDEYEDPDTPNTMGPEQIQRFASDLGVDLDNIVLIVLAFYMNASTLGYFTREEWVDGFKRLGISNMNELKKKKASLEKEWKEPSLFREFYKFCFGYAKDKDQKNLRLEERHPVKVITRDQWQNFLEFCQTVSEDLSGHDESSASSEKKQYLLIAHDYTDEDALNRRLAVRQEHLAKAAEGKKDGLIISGGVMFDSHANQKMVGSSMIFYGTEEEVRERIYNDVYVKGKVWEKIDIIPYKLAPLP